MQNLVLGGNPIPFEGSCKRGIGRTRRMGGKGNDACMVWKSA